MTRAAFLDVLVMLSTHLGNSQKQGKSNVVLWKSDHMSVGKILLLTVMVPTECWRPLSNLADSYERAIYSVFHRATPGNC